MRRIILKVAFLVALIAPTQAMSVIFEEDFVNGEASSLAIQNNWDAFVSEVGAQAGTYNFVRLSGSNDTIGVTCSDPNAVSQLAAALSVVGASASVNCDGNNWLVGQCGTGQEITTTGGICSCPSGYTLRPNIRTDTNNNSNWGGIDSPTCNGPSQTIRLEFNDEGPIAPSLPVPTLGPIALLLLAGVLGLFGWRARRTA